MEEKAERGDELGSKDITPLVDLAYSEFRKSHGASSAYKKKMRDYILTGRCDEETTEFLALAKVGHFPEIARREEARGLLAEMPEHDTNAGVKEAVVNYFAAMKHGSAGTAHKSGYLAKEVSMSLEEALGIVNPERPFLYGTRELAEAVGNGGFAIPMQFNAAKGIACVPEWLMHHYLPVSEFGQIITIFDKALVYMVASYVKHNSEMVSVLDEILKNDRRNLKSVLVAGIIMRAILPDGHAPSMRLYPDSLIFTAKTKEAVRRLMGSIRESREGIPGFLAENFGIPENEILLDELIGMHVELMHVLPCRRTAAHTQFQL